MVESSTEESVEARTSTVTRRSMLRTVGSVGGATAGLTIIGSSRAAPKSSKYVDIDYAYRRKELGDTSTPIILEQKEVARDWYEELRKVEKRRQEAKFEERSYVGEVYTTPPIRGGKGGEVHVGVYENPDGDVSPHLPSTQEAREKIPSKLDNTPIKTFVTGEFNLGCYEDDYGASVPTGAVMEKGYESGYCTLGAALHKDGNRYFSTCQHVFYGDTVSDEKLYNKDEDDAIGDIIEAHCKDDFVVAEPINGHSPSGRIVGSNGDVSDLTIVKQFTKDALQDKIANGESLTKRGVRTCETSGKIKVADGYIGYVDIGCGNRYQQLKWEGGFNGGDSGSVAYQKIGSANDTVGIAGTCNGTDPNLAAPNTFGTGAYKIKNYHGYSYV